MTLSSCLRHFQDAAEDLWAPTPAAYGGLSAHEIQERLAKVRASILPGACCLLKCCGLGSCLKLCSRVWLMCSSC